MKMENDSSRLSISKAIVPQSSSPFEVDQFLGFASVGGYVSSDARNCKEKERERKRVPLPQKLLNTDENIPREHGIKNAFGLPIVVKARCRFDNGPISLRSETSFHRDCRRAAAPIMR